VQQLHIDQVLAAWPQMLHFAGEMLGAFRCMPDRPGCALAAMRSRLTD